MTISTLGIDIAKSTFQLHGADSIGLAVLTVRRQGIWHQPVRFRLTKRMKTSWCLRPLGESGSFR
jgi:hypothetical protein